MHARPLSALAVALAVIGLTIVTAPVALASVTPATLVQSVSTNQTKASTKLTQAGVHPTAAGQVMVAFLASDGPNAAGGQSFSSVTGCSVTWALVKRANAQPGDAEIWQATSAGSPTCTVTATRANGSYQGSVTVATYSGGSVGISVGASANTGAAAATLTGVTSNSAVRGVGSDWTSATARTLLTGQTMVNQMLSSLGDTYWVQDVAPAVSPPANLVVGTSAPAGSRQWNYAAVEIKGVGTPSPACSDGIDNDGDTKIDFPADPGCTSATDTDETDPPPPPAACADGVDNDGDGKIDFPADPGCTSATDTDEADAPPPPAACGDGIDNDNDGKIDFPADPGCTSATDTDETDQPPGGIDALPRVPWEGGPAYYGQFPNANAGGWDDPGFFPISVWYNPASSDEEVQWDKSMGINTYLGQAPTDPGALSRVGMYWIGGPVTGLDPASPQWVGNFLDDEVDGRFSPADGRAYLQGLKDQYAGNGKFDYANFTNTVTQVNMAASDAEAYVNNYTDTVSLDMYFDTVPFCDWNPYPTSFFIEPVPQSTCRTAASYGAEVRMLRTRDAADGRLQPIWQFVENLSGAPAEGPYANATPAQIKGAAMDSVINEARGLVWFNTSFGGSCPAQPVIRRAQVEGTSFCGWNQVQAMKDVNQLIQSMAPILNTQSYQYTFNPAVDTMLKKGPDGSAYVFTMLKNGTGPGVQELTMPAGVTATSVEVLNENRTIPVVNGKFSDTINTDAYHIYKFTP